jgi:hypothetical protein
MDLAGCLLVLCYSYLTMPYVFGTVSTGLCILNIGTTIEGCANQVCLLGVLLGVHHRLDF